MESRTHCWNRRAGISLNYGPASVRDAAYYFGSSQAEIEKRLARLPVEAAKYEGQQLFSLDSGRAPGQSLPDCLLLAGFDPLMLGYEKKQSVFLPPEYLRGIFSLSGIVMPPGAAARQRSGPLEAQRKAPAYHAVPPIFAGGAWFCRGSRGAALGRSRTACLSGRIIDLFKPKNPCYTFLVPHTLVWGDHMKKWVEIMMPVMLFATVLYFCVFAVLTHQSAQTAAMQPGGTTVVLDAGHGGEDGGATRRFRHVGGGAESGYFAAPARPSAPVRRAGQHDPRDGYGGLFRRLPHDLGEKSFGHQKPDRDGEPDGKCTASERAPELLHRGQIPRRTGLLRENARSQALAEQLQANLALGLEPATAVSAKKRTACISWSISAAPACWSNADFYPITRKNSGSCSRSIRKSWPP